MQDGRQPGIRAAGSAGLREKVDFLAAPASHAGRPSRVDTVETHMSWVFIAGDIVYKLKKPVKYPFLDFSTLAAREADCREEVRLNQVLAPNVYLGVVALTRESDSTFAIDGRGPAVDWLVKMRRLPAARMLDRAIEKGTVNETDVERVAERLSAFYRCAAPADVDPEGYVAGFAREQSLNESVLRIAEFGLPRGLVDSVVEVTDRFIVEEADALRARVDAGCVIEGHGDLRPEHVCLLDEPVIFDCLEFNRALRLVDPFDELALLSLECERLGGAWVGTLIFDRCATALGTAPDERLRAFFTAFRALLRARLALAHLLEPEARTPKNWAPLALDYLAIAERASLTLYRPKV